MASDDRGELAWTKVMISSLREIAQLHGEDALEVQLGDGVGLRSFLPDSVVLTYSYPPFYGGYGYVENLLFACRQWSVELGVWSEYCDRADPVETACQLSIDGDCDAFESWLSGIMTELLGWE